MWTEFEGLPDDSRIWIFTIQGDLSETLSNLIYSELKNFIQEWTSHQRTLNAGAKLIENRFLVIALDQSQSGASGCSIDKLMRFIQNLESITGLGLLLKNKIGIKVQESIHLLDIQDIKRFEQEGKLNHDTQYFDTLIDNKYALDHQWVKPLKEGWLGKKLKL